MDETGKLFDCSVKHLFQIFQTVGLESLEIIHQHPKYKFARGIFFRIYVGYMNNIRRHVGLSETVGLIAFKR